MDKDETIKKLNEEVTLLQSKVRSYARLGELYENTRAELKQLRAHSTGAEVSADNLRRAYGSEDNISLSHPYQRVDIVEKSADPDVNPAGVSRSASLPVSGPGPPTTMSQPYTVDHTTVSVSRPPPTPVAALVNADNWDYSMTAPTIQNNDSDSSVPSNMESLVAGDKSADFVGQSSFAGKLADLVAEGNRLQQLVAENTTKLEAKDRIIDTLTQELRQAKEQLKKIQSQGQRGAASDWVVLGDKVQQRDGSEELTASQGMHERKVAELVDMVKQLKTANKCWEQHLKQVNKDNAARQEAGESECRALRQQLADAGTLRHDCDEAVTEAKRLAKDAEKDKQRAVAEVSDMKRKCEQLEASLALVHQREREKKSGAERRCHEMVNIIQGQKEYINKLELQLMNQSTATVSIPQVVVPSHNTTDLSLPTEVMLLHQQVALWKEDFEKERADREKAQSELDTVRKVSMEDRALLHKERDTCRQLKDKLEQAEREIRDLQAKLIEKAAELQRLKLSMHKYNFPTATAAAEVPKQWNCTKCTFMNADSDRYCAMCGSMSWQRAGVTPSAPPRERHLLHHDNEGPDVCDGGHVYNVLPPRNNFYYQRY